MRLAVAASLFVLLAAAAPGQIAVWIWDCFPTGGLPEGWSNEGAIPFRGGTGPTPTPGTGPDADHTSGSGSYVFMNAALNYSASSAVLRSPLFNLGAGGTCDISFWYHMQGTNVGSLSLDVINGSGVHTVWSSSGNQGNGWRQATISYGTAVGNPGDFRLRFRATRLTGSACGDIALDDIQVTRGS
jgi:hypothetical protein